MGIIYHANFPYPADPFYLHNPVDNGGRMADYGVFSVPRVKLDGATSPTSYSSLQVNHDARMAIPTDLSLEITGEWDSGSRQVDVTVTASTTSALNGDYLLHIALTESEVYFEGLNGINWHEHTLRAMYPSYAGTPVTFTGDFPQTAAATASFVLPEGAPPHEYRAEFCQIVCFLQEVGASAAADEVHQAGAVRIEELSTTAVAELPGAPRLGRNYPNPFNPDTVIPIELDAAGDLFLSVLDVRGRELRVLHSGYLDSGRHELRWDGRDSRGRAMPSGVYLARASGAAGSSRQRLVLLK